jgi:hypothetical protein
MTITPTAPPANFNLAVETLKRTLRQDKIAATVLSQAQEPQERVGLIDDVTDLGLDLSLGQHINTDV